jgi:hypothetical protein
MKNKQIITRNLPLTIKYTVIDKKYIPLESGYGCTCDNCGKLIANIATVKNESNEVFNIGFDCMETLLINNQLLSGYDLQAYEAIKKMIPKIIRFSKSIKDTINKNTSLNITGLSFETQTYTSDYYTFYWLKNNELKSRDNDYVKLKDIDFNFLIETLKNIFPKLEIIIN